MSERTEDLADAELAQWQHAHRSQLDSEHGEEVEVDISAQLSVTISFRLPGAEADAIRQAAEDAGMTLSEWVRRACSHVLDPDRSGRRHREVQAELRDATRQLEELARRLDAAAHG